LHARGLEAARSCWGGSRLSPSPQRNPGTLTQQRRAKGSPARSRQDPQRTLPALHAGTRTSAAWSLLETGDTAQCCLLTGWAGATGGQGEQAGPFPRNAGVPHGGDVGFGGNPLSLWVREGGSAGASRQDRQTEPLLGCRAALASPQDAKPRGVRGPTPGRDRCRSKPSGRGPGCPLSWGSGPRGVSSLGTRANSSRPVRLCRSCLNGSLTTPSPARRELALLSLALQARSPHG